MPYVIALYMIMYKGINISQVPVERLFNLSTHSEYNSLFYRLMHYSSKQLPQQTKKYQNY